MHLKLWDKIKKKERYPPQTTTVDAIFSKIIIASTSPTFKTYGARRGKCTLVTPVKSWYFLMEILCEVNSINFPCTDIPAA